MEHTCKVIAHRGASGLAPENTLAAVQKAMDIGVDMIEIDVQQASDGTIVLMHDRTLSRTTNGKGRLSKQSPAALRKLDAGSWFAPEFSGEHVPTLEEVFQLVAGNATLLIEVKDHDLVLSIFCRRLIKLVQAHNAYSWVVVQSFSSKVLKALYRLEPRIELNKLINYTLPGVPLYNDGRMRMGTVAEELYTTAVNVNSRHFSTRLARHLRARNRTANLWTVNDPQAMKRLIKMGADGIITNYPDKLKQVLAELALEKQSAERPVNRS